MNLSTSMPFSKTEYQLLTEWKKYKKKQTKIQKNQNRKRRSKNSVALVTSFDGSKKRRLNKEQKLNQKHKLLEEITKLETVTSTNANFVDSLA